MELANAAENGNFAPMVRRSPEEGSRDIPLEHVTQRMPLWYRLCWGACLMGARLLYGFTVHGAERAPRTGPLIVAANHSQNADTAFAILAIPRRMHVMVKKEAFRSPFARLLNLVAFPVDRERGGFGGLRQAWKLLSSGAAVGIAPEGFRRNERAAGEASKGGMALLAARTKAPILPIYLGKAPTFGAGLRGERMVVHIGEPVTIDRDSLDGLGYREVSSTILRTIYALPAGGETPGSDQACKPGSWRKTK